MILRVTDTPTLTVLEKAWASGQGGSGETPNRTVSNSNGNSTVAAITLVQLEQFQRVRIYGAGNKLYFSSGGKNGGNLDSGTVNTTLPAQRKTLPRCGQSMREGVRPVAARQHYA
ncbi:hypothetical protein ACRAWF_01920, partial [Streptomyces sp. L7]